jgi:tRNA(Arg) A34 adenosine deaminase TadA
MKTWVGDIAIKAAKNSLFRPYQHAAVLESGGALLAIACNQPKASNPQTSCSIHAEVSAIRKMGLRAKRCDIYVARVVKGRVGLSQPCPKCLHAIKATGWIEQIFFSQNDGSWGTIKT